MNIELNSKYKISDSIISKQIEGELVIVPLDSGMGDLNSELYSLNKTGVAVWEKLDGEKSVFMIIQDISVEYSVSSETIESEIINLIKELFQRKLIFKI